MPAKPDRATYGVLQRYIEHLKQFPRTRIMRPGYFYAFTYKIDRTLPYEKIKFYDLMPFVFSYDKYKDKGDNDMIRGLNFHHLPIAARQFWLDRVMEVSKEQINEDKRLLRLIRYQRLHFLYKKAANACTRHYRMNRIFAMRRIPNTAVEETLKFYARTYYGINIGIVEKNFITVPRD